MDGIEIERVTSPTDEVRALIAALDRTLAAMYRPEHRHGLSIDGIFRPHVAFFVARLDGTAVGCGGVALSPAFGEVKRMFVEERARGRGVAQSLLARLETETATSGRNLLRLETGTRQHAAIRLYERAGYRRCEAFGEYAEMTPEAISISLYYEKTVGPRSDLTVVTEKPSS